jgi:hypothetical protein
MTKNALWSPFVLEQQTCVIRPAYFFSSKDHSSEWENIGFFDSSDWPRPSTSGPLIAVVRLLPQLTSFLVDLGLSSLRRCTTSLYPIPVLVGGLSPCRAKVITPDISWQGVNPLELDSRSKNLAWVWHWTLYVPKTGLNIIDTNLTGLSEKFEFYTLTTHHLALPRPPHSLIYSTSPSSSPEQDSQLVTRWITSDILWTGEGASHGIWCGEQVSISGGAYLSSTFVRYISSNQRSLYVRHISSSLAQPTSAFFNRSLSLATDSTSPVSLFSTSTRGALMCPAKESLSPTSTSLFYDQLLGWTTSPLTDFKASWLVSPSLFRFELHDNSILRAGIQVSTTR